MKFMNRLENKVAVITASTQGMGEGIARLFASEGASVVISGRNEKMAQTSWPASSMKAGKPFSIARM